MKGRLFITDLGKNQFAEISSETKVVGRYAVWAPIRNSERHQVIEVGERLEDLKEKYRIPADRVCSLIGIQGEGE